MDTVVNTKWGRANLNEALCLVGSPTCLSFSILAKLALGQVIGRVDTYSLESIRTELKYCCTCYVALAAGEHCLDIWHYWLQILALVQEHSVPVGYLVLPVLLPLRECRLLKKSVCLDNQLRSCCLETYATLDADDGVAHVGIATDSVRCTNFLDLLDGLNLIVELLVVNSYYLTLVESNLQCSLLLRSGNVLKVSLLGQTLCWVEQLTAADRCTPDTYVVRVLKLGEVSKETMLVQIVNLLFAGKLLITGKGDNLYAWSHNQEGHVEADLVVTSTC